MELRDYQRKLIEDCRQSLRSHRRIIACLPCRAGKTMCFAYIARRHALKGGRVWFLAHRRELVDQARETLRSLGAEDPNIYIGSVSTALRRAPFEPTLIVFDEAHHSSASTWKKIIEAYPDAYVVGLTATPTRMDGAPLGCIYQDIVEGPSAKQLIEQKRISPYKYYAPDLNLRDAEWVAKGSDFDQEDAARRLDRPAIFGEAAKLVSPGRKTIIYCPTIAYSQKLAASIPGCEHIDGSTPKRERERILSDFRSGKIWAMSNVDLFGEGLDVPDCNTAILLRPTASLTLFIQQSMRCMTYMTGKTAIVYDLVGNAFRHGLPTDDHEWSLTKPVRQKKLPDPETKVRECKQCFRCYSPPVRVCPYCGNDNGMTKKQIAEAADRELREIHEMEKKKQKKLQGMARTREELIALAISRGYKNPSGWAYNILKSRRKQI